MQLHLHITGFLLIALALLHIIFPVYFKWKSDLQPLSLINRQIIMVHTFFIAFTVLLMGLLCLNAAAELTGTILGKKIALGLAVFWTVRLFIQFFGYSSKLWKGKAFETGVHIFFSLLWKYLACIFWWVATG